MNPKKFEIKNSILKIDSLQFSFDFPIQDYLEVDSMLILLLKIPNGVKYSENIFGFNLVTKEIKWQIEKVSETESYPLPTNSGCPYVEIGITGSSNLKVFNWCDFHLTIDPKTGRILSRGYNK